MNYYKGSWDFIFISVLANIKYYANTRIGVQTVSPCISVTLQTNSISERTNTGMSGDTLPAVTYPRLTEVTYSTLSSSKEYKYNNTTTYLTTVRPQVT